MNGQGLYNDEQTALLMKQRKELIALRSRDVGDNMKWIFCMTIIAAVAKFLVALEEVLIASHVIIYNDFIKISYAAATVVVVICAVFYAVKLFALRCHSESFYYAGFLYGVCELLNVARNALSGYTEMAVVSVIYAILQIVQLLFFVDGVTSSLRGVNRDVELGWISYRKLYSKVLYAMILSAICIFVPLPLIFLIAVLALEVIGILSFVLSIWLVILIWQTGTAQQNYALLAGY